jgi:4-hydroxy-tetrahydrodipicolinate reductase
MNLLILGRGKTGSLVAQVAEESGHSVRSMTNQNNPHASGLTSESLRDVDVVIDFTNPAAVVESIGACIRHRKNMVIGTTGWDAAVPEIRRQVEEAGIGFVYSPNFSIGVNVFFEIARAASPLLKNGYSARIIERHHAQKKDAPSGTAIAIRSCLQPELPADPLEKIEIASIREGDAVGQHVLLLDSDSDTLMLVHDAKSRRGFAVGAVRAAEWISGKKGFFSFRDVLRDTSAGR